MSIWDQSEHPGELPASTPHLDKHMEHQRPADGTHAGTTNRTPSRSVNTRISIKNGRILFIRHDNSIAATFSIVPEYDPDSPIIVIARTGFDAYLDILGVPRPNTS